MPSSATQPVNAFHSAGAPSGTTKLIQRPSRHSNSDRSPRGPVSPRRRGISPCQVYRLAFAVCRVAMLTASCRETSTAAPRCRGSRSRAASTTSDVASATREPMW